MGEVVLPHVLGDIGRFATSGKFADFEIRCGAFSFKVHRLVICAASKYFEALCGGSFKEASESSTHLDEEDPKAVFRMIQACYSGDYGSDEQETQLAELHPTKLTFYVRDVVRGGGLPRFEPAGLVIHAQMYGLADKFDIPNLRSLALKKFEARIKSEVISDEEVLAAGLVIYETIPRNDDKLRKLVVYHTQMRMLELKHLPYFKELMADQDFSWDYGTKYASRAHLWCPECILWTRITARCKCGFHGLCEESDVCKDQNWNALKCEKCKKHGHLLREQPKDNLEMATDGAMKSRKHGTAPTTSPPTPKKRLRLYCASPGL